MSGMHRRLPGICGAVSLAAGIIAIAPAAQASDPNNSPAHVDTAYPHNQPPYPASAQLNGEQGTVTVGIEVGDNGHIRKARVVGSSGFDDLDNAALAGIMGWHFAPAMKDGDTVTDWATIKIVFQLPAAVPASTPAQPPAPAH